MLVYAVGSEHRASLEIWRQHPDIGCFGAVLAAVARDIGAATIVSADRAFATVPGVEHTFPDETAGGSLARDSSRKSLSHEAINEAGEPLEQRLYIDAELAVGPQGPKIAGHKRQAVLSRGRANEGVIDRPTGDVAPGK